MRYDDDPQGSLTFIRDTLNLKFNHQQRKRGEKPNLPTKLDPEAISHTWFLDEALRRDRGSLKYLGETGLDFVMRNEVDLRKEQARDLLRRLQWPDYPNLVDLVAADLKLKESRGFGEFKIHGSMLQDQLIELAQKHPAVKADQEYINARIVRLRPNDDVNWRYRLDEREAYLERVRAYVMTLASAQNSLKAHVLYHLLDVKRQRGEYDRKLFLTYLGLPRGVSYIEPRLLNLPQNRGVRANLGQNYLQTTHCPPIRDDQELVWDYLSEFLLADKNPDVFREFIRKEQLETLWAETMLQGDEGDAQKWFSILGPSRVTARNLLFAWGA